MPPPRRASSRGRSPRTTRSSTRTTRRRGGWRPRRGACSSRGAAARPAPVRRRGSRRGSCSRTSAAPRHAVVAAASLALPGAHNLENALAALAAAECLGAPQDAIVSALTRFEGLPHRSQLVAEAGGVRWVDDSKGTNVDATAKSLEGYAPGSVLLILGGRDKHGDFAALAELVRRNARVVLTIGEAAPRHREGPGRRGADRAGADDGRPRSRARPGSRGRATPCCCRRPARPSTSIATTRSGAIISRGWPARPRRVSDGA